MARRKDVEAGRTEATDERPPMTAESWNDWVINQLRDGEKDPQGHPKVGGLRRLAEEILGPVVRSVPEHVEGATAANGMRATVSHAISIAWGGVRDDIRTFGAVADVYSGNTDDEFARFAAATADTRAEARALRKALRLNAVAAEEITSLPISESGLGQYIVKSQERGIETLCKRLDINVFEFINSGKGRYDRIGDVPFTAAQQMLERLNRYQQIPAEVPESIRGYATVA